MAPRRLVHVSVQAIRWGDMDALGHVNNTLYFRYMEQARTEWLEAQAAAGLQAESQGCVIANASCDFLIPLIYPGTIDVRMFLGEPGRSSVGSFYEIWAGERKHADGAARIVWIDRSTGRPTPLPGGITAVLRAACD